MRTYLLQVTIFIHSSIKRIAIVTVGSVGRPHGTVCRFIAYADRETKSIVLNKIVLINIYDFMCINFSGLSAIKVGRKNSNVKYLLANLI